MTGVPISLDFRKRIVAAMGEPSSTYESVAERFQVSTATLNRVWRLYRETGLHYPPLLRGRTPFTLDGDDLEVLRGLVNDVPDATLDALTDDVVQITGKPVSR